MIDNKESNTNQFEAIVPAPSNNCVAGLQPNWVKFPDHDATQDGKNKNNVIHKNAKYKFMLLEDVRKPL